VTRTTGSTTTGTTGTTTLDHAAAIAGALPDEVVTRAIVRDVALPGGAGTMALITLDNGRDHTRPSTFGPAGLAELRETVIRIGDSL